MICESVSYRMGPLLPRRLRAALCIAAFLRRERWRWVACPRPGARLSAGGPLPTLDEQRVTEVQIGRDPRPCPRSGCQPPRSLRLGLTMAPVSLATLSGAHTPYGESCCRDPLAPSWERASSPRSAPCRLAVSTRAKDSPCRDGSHRFWRPAILTETWAWRRPFILRLCPAVHPTRRLRVCRG